MADPANQQTDAQDLPPDPAVIATAGPLDLRNDPSPEELALQDAMKAEEAAGNEGAAPGAGAEPQAQPQAAPQAPQAQNQPGKREPIMVPIERLNAALADRDKHRDTANYLQGRLEAVESAVQPAQQPGQHPQPMNGHQPAPPPRPMTLDELKSDIATKRVSIQKQYDNAELTSEQYAQQLAALDGQMIDGVANAIRASQPPAQTSLVDEAIQDQHAANLSKTHPYVDHLGQQHLSVLTEMVSAEWRAMGRFGTFKSKAAEDMAFREAVAKMSDVKGPEWFPDLQVQRQPPTTVPNRGQPQLSPAAAARQAKLTQAANAPPDLSQVGKPGNFTDLTEADILNMTPQQLENLPQHVIAKFLQ